MTPLVGQDIAPPDLVAKITGRARYAEDFRADGMVFCKLLLSPMPHARVRRINASAALRMEGVIDILTADDVPQRDAPREQSLSNEPVYEGQPVLAVAAVDEATAAAAIEAIRVDFEPLPFVIDPLESLAPRGPNAHAQGNIYAGREWHDWKWSQEDYETARAGRMPGGPAVTEWTVGDLDAGFAAADLVLEEGIVQQSLTHHPMESRSTMAYWENGKLFCYTSVQSTVRSHVALAGALDMDPDDIVFVAEYCGGGFGSKISGHITMEIPAVFSRKIGRPVMLRVSRYEETSYGRARPGYQGFVRMGFRSDGWVTALDLYLLQDSGPFGAGDYNTSGNLAHLTYTPDAMRLRGVPMLTNTQPKSAQRGPGGAQIINMMEPLMDKAAWALGLDRLAIRRLNAPGPDARMGPRGSSFTSVHVREAIDLGAETFGWEEKIALSGRRNGSKVTGVGMGVSPYTAGSRGYDGIVLIRPDGRLYVHQGVGNLGTHSVMDTTRAAADVLGYAWEDVDVVWGDTSRGLPWSCSQGGSQTTHAHTRANHAAATDALGKIQEIAARSLGGAAGRYRVANGRVSGPGGSMSLGDVARRAMELGGRYDGHELPEDIHAVTTAACGGLMGQGLLGVARDNYGGEGSVYSWVVGFAVVELDHETGEVEILEYTGVTDCGTVLHPRSLGAQVLGGSIQGMGMAMSQNWVYDPKWGVPFAKRLYTARPPGILDVPRNLNWAAVGIPDPQTPVGAKGIGEPPVGAGAAALGSAVADAMGGRCLCRTPLTPDIILAELEGRRKPSDPMTMHVG